MSIQVTWTNTEKTRLRLDFDKVWDWIDYQFAISISAKEIEAQDHPVDLLVVLTQNTSLPPGAFVQFRQSLDHLPPNLGTISVVIGQDTFAALFMSAFVKTCPGLCHKLILVESLDEARLELSHGPLVHQLA